MPRPGFEPTTSWGLHFLTVVFNKNVAQSVERRALGTLEMALNQKIDLKKEDFEIVFASALALSTRSYPVL